MEAFSYEYNVTYTVTVPVTVISSGGRRAADTVAHTAVAKGLLRIGPEHLDSVKVEYMMKGYAPLPDEARDMTNVFRDGDEEEVRDED